MTQELPPNADGIARDLYLSTIRFRPWTKAEQNSLKKEIIFHNNRMIAMEATEMGEDINIALARYPESFFVESTEFLDWEKISSVVRSSPVPLVLRTIADLGLTHR